MNLSNWLELADVDQVHREGLKAFIELAWPEVEPNPLVWSPHLDRMCDKLEAVTRGDIQNLVINVPPGCSKSLIVSTFWPAWMWTVDPSLRYITATYSQSLSNKNARLHRDLVASDWFQGRWGERCAIDAATLKQVRLFENSAKGWRFSTSTGGEVMGRHADILIADDLVKGQDASGKAAVDAIAVKKANDFWFNTIQTRRADPAKTRQVLIMQRLHHEDAAARALEDGWDSLILPMEYDPSRSDPMDWRTEEGELLAPERFPREVLEELKKPTRLGSLQYASQMQQVPTPPTGNLIDLTAILRFEDWPRAERTIVTVDANFSDNKQVTPDPVAIHVWAKAKNNVYLFDRRHGVFSVARTAALVKELAKTYRGSGVYIENKANGHAVEQQLRAAVPGLNLWNPGTSKVGRVMAIEPFISAGNVYIPSEKLAPWAGPVVQQLGQFPLGRHDDDVDAMTMALLVLLASPSALLAEAYRKMK